MKSTNFCYRKAIALVLLLSFVVVGSTQAQSKDALIQQSEADPDNLDVHLFRSINNHHTPFLDAIIDVNDYTVTPAAIAAPLGLMAYGLIARSDYETDSGILLGLSALVSEGASQMLKHIIKRERPYSALVDVNVSHLSSAGDPYSSFPSGHTTVAFTLATTLTLRYPKLYVAVPLYLWASLVGYGRLYLGVHYPTDVLVGAILGSAIAVVIYLFQDDIIAFKNRLLGSEHLLDVSRQQNEISFSLLPIAEGGAIRFVYRF